MPVIYVFLTLKVTVTTDLHYLHQQGQRFQLKIFFTDQLKTKPTSWMALGVSKLTSNLHFWVNYPFKTSIVSV